MAYYGPTLSFKFFFHCSFTQFRKINIIFVLPFHIQQDFKILDKTTVTFLTGIQIYSSPVKTTF